MLSFEPLWTAGSKLPTLSPRHVQDVLAAIDGYADMPRGSSPARIGKFVATAALAYPAARISAEEADARLRLYQSELCDIHHETLGAAFSAAVRSGRFFPSISEIREHAAKLPPPNRVVVFRRLARLRAAIEAQPSPSVDLVDPSELRGLVAKLSGALTVA